MSRKGKKDVEEEVGQEKEAWSVKAENHLTYDTDYHISHALHAHTHTPAPLLCLISTVHG